MQTTISVARSLYMPLGRILVVSIAALGSLLSAFTPGSILAAEHIVAMRDNFFSPANLTVQNGDTVRWVNQGANPHTATSLSAIWDSGVLNSGGSFSRVFATSGSFPYHCTVHPQVMTGTITVSSTGEPEPQLYMVSISATCVTTNASGRLRVEPMGTRQILAECAAENMLAARDLVLVYNLETDAIEAVLRTNGVTACTIATLAGGLSVASQDGTRRERQAFLFWEEGEDAVGSLVGTEQTRRAMDGTLAKFSFRGSFSLGLHAYGEDEDEAEPPRVCRGTFATGRRFVVP